MDIAIIPGATVAVVRIKIKAKVTNIDTDIDTYTKWKLLYKPIYNHNYFETEELQYNSPGVYGYGPLFYDLTNLEPNTKYCIKLVITECDESITIRETSEKSFTTVSEGTFAFKSREYKNSTDTQEEFNNILDWFENCMIASGYDYNITNERTERPFRDNIASPKVIADADYLSRRGAGGTASNKGDITLRYFNINSNYDKKVILHEYRHFLGLSDDDIQYHGDCWHNYGTWHRTGYGSGYGYFPQAIEYYNNICKVTSFSRGVDTEDMEIYMYYGENSVDSMYIPDNSGWRYLGFMLLKALGLNDIYIAYNDPVVYYDYTITITNPEDVEGSVIYEWFEDEPCLTKIDNETNNTIRTTKETIWVKVTVNGETYQYELNNGEEKQITIESSTVVIDALPIVQSKREYNKWDVSTEGTIFPIVVSNDKNKSTTYDLSINNTYHQGKTFRKRIANGIDIGNGQSVFIISKGGYAPSESGYCTGTFTISCTDADEDKTLTITSNNMTDHAPNIRCNSSNNSYVFSNIHLIPHYGGNIDSILLGTTQCARIDTETNTIYSYGSGKMIDDEPTESSTYKCYKGYRYLKWKVINGTGGYRVEPVVSYDTESMISNLQFYFDQYEPRIYSHFKSVISPNPENNRMRFGVVYLGKDVTNPDIEDTGCLYMDSIIQESENIRFVLPRPSKDSNYNIFNFTSNSIIPLETIDLSKQGEYTFPSYSELFFLNNDVVNKITVTDMSNNVISPTTTTPYGDSYLYGVSYYISDNYSDGYIITIN